MKIKKKLLIILLSVSLIPVFVLEIDNLNKMEQTLIDESLNHLKSISQLEKQRFSDNIEKEFEILSIIKSDIHFRSTLYDFNKSGDDDETRNSLNVILLELKKLNPNISRISVLG